MGYKAEIKRLTSLLEVKRKQTDILYAALKVLVMQTGTHEDNDWKIDIPMFQPGEINTKYTIDTTPNDDSMTMTVTEHNDLSETLKGESNGNRN